MGVYQINLENGKMGVIASDTPIEIGELLEMKIYNEQGNPYTTRPSKVVSVKKVT